RSRNPQSGSESSLKTAACPTIFPRSSPSSTLISTNGNERRRNSVTIVSAKVTLTCHHSFSKSRGHDLARTAIVQRRVVDSTAHRQGAISAGGVKSVTLIGKRALNANDFAVQFDAVRTALTAGRNPT